MQLYFSDESIIICDCVDARCFSSRVLRGLLLSEDQSSVICAAALSENDGKVQIKLEKK